jgi:hypothetical protein
MSDFEFLSVEFEFEGGTYNTLIRKKRKASGTEYCITVMNGKLEKLLYGNHIIKEKDGVLQADYSTENTKMLQLKQCITKALQQHLANERAAPV